MDISDFVKKAKEYNLQKYYEEFCKIIDRNSES